MATRAFTHREWQSQSAWRLLKVRCNILKQSNDTCLLRRCGRRPASTQTAMCREHKPVEQGPLRNLGPFIVLRTRQLPHKDTMGDVTLDAGHAPHMVMVPVRDNDLRSQSCIQQRRQNDRETVSMDAPRSAESNRLSACCQSLVRHRHLAALPPVPPCTRACPRRCR